MGNWEPFKMKVKKKVEIIANLGKDETKLLVQKSNPLLSLSQSEITLAEFKILDIYLSRINSREPNKRMVVFEKGELEKILGVKQIKTEELDKRLAHLQGSTVNVIDPNVKRGFKRITLFEMSHAIQDDDGLWRVELMCTPSAMQYVFNIEKIGYLCYALQSITAITSRYTYILFLYLEKNRYRKSWQIDLEELKQILNCSAERYEHFKFFNSEILKQCQKELFEKTECKYTYEPIRKKRKVIAIKFTLETLSDFVDINYENEELIKNIKSKTYDDNLSEYDKWIQDYCNICDNVFSKNEMEEFIGMINKLPLKNMYSNSVIDDIYVQKLDYLMDKYRAFKTANSKNSIKNKYSYFKKMIEKDIDKYNF